MNTSQDEAPTLNDSGLYPSETLVSAATNRPVPKGGCCEPIVPCFWCPICASPLNTPLQAIQHFRGKVHAMKSQNQHSNNANANQGIANAYKRGYDSIQAESYQNVSAVEPAEKKVKTQLAQASSEAIICNDCNTMFNSSAQAEQHFNGKKHALQVASKASAQNEKVSLVLRKPGQDANIFRCEPCNMSLNSREQYVQHCKGIKHKVTVGTIKEVPDWWVEQQDKYGESRAKKGSGTGVAEQYKCGVCNIHLNSQLQLSQHLISKRHKEVEEEQLSNSNRGRGRGRGNNPRGRGNPARGGRGGRGGQNDRGGRRGGGRGDGGRGGGGRGGGGRGGGGRGGGGRGGGGRGGGGLGGGGRGGGDRGGFGGRGQTRPFSRGSSTSRGTRGAQRGKPNNSGGYVGYEKQNNSTECSPNHMPVGERLRARVPTMSNTDFSIDTWSSVPQRSEPYTMSGQRWGNGSSNYDSAAWTPDPHSSDVLYNQFYG